MIKIIFTDFEGTETTVETQPGTSLMEVAVQNMVPGIEAECGGGCSCATCHVIVDDEWFARLNPIESTEESMLEFVEEPQPNSRLSCQVKVTDEMDGLKVTTPENQ